jgi:hypothetical protein
MEDAAFPLLEYEDRYLIALALSGLACYPVPACPERPEAGEWALDRGNDAVVHAPANFLAVGRGLSAEFD